MKKIIYSLVIMIAAGSLFTSCIEQVEPLGIQDMRFAKAEYIRALKDLRAADAELVRAEAAHELARARYVDAMTANLNADTEYQNLLNEYQQLINEARQDTNDYIAAETANKIDSIKKLMAERELTHQKNMVAAQDSLESANERLRVALRNIALASQSLTPAEKEALENATEAYQIAFEKVAKQTVKVFEAQQKVHEAEIALAKADKEIDEDTYQYVDALEYYNRKLEEAQVTSALSGLALLAIGYNFTDTADLSGIIIPEDLSEWKSEIEALEDSIAVLDYSKAAIITEIANYYVANIHDGVEAFNDAVTAFKAENWWEDGTVLVEPELTDAEADTLSWGEPKQDQFKMGFADTIAMPVLEYGNGFAYKQFNAMIAPYFTPFTNAVTGTDYTDEESGDPIVMIKQNTAVKTLTPQVNQAWKEFILGTKEGTVDSQVYTEKDDEGNITTKIISDYGLKGAVSVLERKKVYEAATPTNYADSLDKYQKIWKTDRDTLSKVYDAYYALAKSKRVEIGSSLADSAYMKAYKPYADSLAKYNAAHKAKTDAVSDSATIAGKMVTATTAFITAYNNHINGGTWSTADSTEMLNAIVEFAKAREAYFTASNGLKTNVAPFTTKDGHPNWLHYLKSKEPKVIDSIEIKNLNMTELRTKVEMESISDSKYAWYDVVAGTAVHKDVFQVIFGQVFNADVLDKLEHDALITDATVMNGGNSFYGQFEFVPKAGSVAAHFAKADHTAMPAVADDERAAEKTALENLDVPRTNFKAVYKKYWGNTAEPTMATFVDPRSYVDTTFTEPFCIVSYEGADMDSAPLVMTKGLETVLISINAKTSPERALGTDKRSDFAHYMFWLDKAGTIDEDDLNVIKDWVSAVEHAFALDAEEAGMPNVEAYEEAKAAYDRVNAKAEKVKAYLAKKKEFTGEDKDGNPNEFVEITISDYDQFNEFFTKDEVTFELVPKDPIYDVYTGKWIKALGGKQLEIANTLFPKLPENMKEWQDNLDSINDRKEHVETLQTAYGKAYKSAAKAKYDVEGSTLDDVIANVQREVVNDFAVVIEDYFDALDDIKTYTEDIRDYDQKVHVEKVHPAELALAKAQRDLAIATAKLDGYQEVLAYAKANLDKILEYIKSLDVNFVVVTDDDIKNNKDK